MKLKMDLLKSLGPLVLALVALAILTHPTRVMAADPLRGLDKFEVDCVITINVFPFPGTCKGDQIGSGAAIVDTPGGGTALGTDSSGVPCILQTSTETLTAHDGSTLTLKTDGITCNSMGAGRSIRPTGYQITGGTGRFAGATGAGTLVVSLAGTTFNTSSHFLIHIDGNIQLPGDKED